ncbi:ShlB/FhaC/HecB family hemolysin secretion/activation protein [Kovacikia minuta]|uniref:ShlB/FhaC/HecB family hemolysin secretion/activation protein n=1 Tax=Kovacikia minuta TaxID=2931930 RepID=UPI0020C79808|nr:POTRA domain-containing protein [Kovacikia minuta]
MNLILRWFSASAFNAAMVAGVALKAVAQSMPPAGATVPPSAPGTIEQITPTPSESPSPLPTTPPPASTPAPSLEIPAPPSPPEIVSPSQERFRVKKIEVLGNTVLQQEIADLVKQYLAKQDVKKAPESQGLTLDDLLELRSQITQLYVDNGYVTSGAFLPNNQALNRGIVQIQVVEGELERIEISGLSHLRENYVRRRLERATAPPLNRQRLESALQLLQIDPLIAQVNAQLTAGSTPGRNVLIVELKEAPAFHAGVEIDNSQSPSIGSIQGSVFAEHNNLLGFGDRLGASFGKTEGLNLYNVSYAVPLNPLNGTLSLRYSNDDSEIIEPPFQNLGIRSESRTFSIGFRQPIVRSPQTEFALGLSLDLRRSQTYLLDDIPFSFSEGPEDGKSKVTVIRFSQDWVPTGCKTSIRRAIAVQFWNQCIGCNY